MPIALLEQLAHYQPFDAIEAGMKQRLQHFLETQRDAAFVRALNGTSPEWGHITGSCWIIDRPHLHCIMLHHAKLNKWVQPGGHCDGETDALSTAQREAWEETALQVVPVTPDIFDIDIHVIPEYWNTPEHLHFDVTYLFYADPNQPVVSNRESHAVRWVTLDQALQLSNEETVKRMVQKTRAL